MSNHTKLEWKQAANADYKHEIYTQDPQNANSTRVLCTVTRFKDIFNRVNQADLDKEWHDNAKLIVSAPKLLSALQNLVNSVTVDTENPESLKYVKEAQELVDSLK